MKAIETLTPEMGLQALRAEWQEREAAVIQLRAEQKIIHDLCEPLEIQASAGRRDDAIQRIAQLLSISKDEAAAVYAQKSQGVSTGVKLG